MFNHLISELGGRIRSFAFLYHKTAVACVGRGELPRPSRCVSPYYRQGWRQGPKPTSKESEHRSFDCWNLALSVGVFQFWSQAGQEFAFWKRRSRVSKGIFVPVQRGDWFSPADDRL